MRYGIFSCAQVRLEEPRLRVHAEEHREVLPLARSRSRLALRDFVRDELRLLAVVASSAMIRTFSPPSCALQSCFGGGAGCF